MRICHEQAPCGLCLLSEGSDGIVPTQHTARVLLSGWDVWCVFRVWVGVGAPCKVSEMRPRAYSSSEKSKHELSEQTAVIW